MEEPGEYKSWKGSIFLKDAKIDFLLNGAFPNFVELARKRIFVEDSDNPGLVKTLSEYFVRLSANISETDNIARDQLNEYIVFFASFNLLDFDNVQTNMYLIEVIKLVKRICFWMKSLRKIQLLSYQK